MSSAGASDTLKEESETVEQATEEKVKDETANGSGGENDDDEEEEEDDDDEDDDEKKEKSLIVEGKREKKKVERLCLEMSVVKKEPVLTEGKGKKLYDIERVQYFLKKKKCEELRLLHRLLFNRQGTVNMIKKNIGQFNGFPFEKGSEQCKKKEDMLKKFKKDDLKNICGVLDLEKSGVNSELISRIMKFLMEPKSTGKPLPKSKSKPLKGGKKERSSSGSARKSKSRKSNVILTDESSSEEEKKDKEESSADEKESEEEVEDEQEDEEPPKKVTRKEKAKPKAASKSKKAAKPSNVKKADSSTTKSTSSSKKEQAVQSESEDDSSDDEPLIKKVNKPPTDDDLRETIKKLLAEADLAEVTMKQICKKVNESYPNCDLFSRKKFIKTTVKELIS